MPSKLEQLRAYLESLDNETLDVTFPATLRDRFGVSKGVAKTSLTLERRARLELRFGVIHVKKTIKELAHDAYITRSQSRVHIR